MRSKNIKFYSHRNCTINNIIQNLAPAQTAPPAPAGPMARQDIVLTMNDREIGRAIDVHLNKKHRITTTGA